MAFPEFSYKTDQIHPTPQTSYPDSSPNPETPSPLFVDRLPTAIKTPFKLIAPTKLSKNVPTNNWLEKQMFIWFNRAQFIAIATALATDYHFESVGVYALFQILNLTSDRSDH